MTVSVAGNERDWFQMTSAMHLTSKCCPLHCAILTPLKMSSDYKLQLARFSLDAA
jgi:hypothetical protein